MQAEERFSAEWRELVLACGLRSVRLMPVRGADGHLLASLAIYHDHPRDPTPADSQLIEIGTHLAALALALARRRSEQSLREEKRVQELLAKVSESLVGAQLDPERVVQIATDAATELSGAAFGAFFYNVETEQGESYTLFTLSGAPREAFAGYSNPRNTAVFGPTFRGEAVVRSDDITADPRYGQNAPHRGTPEGHPPVRSYLAVPVRSTSGEVLGGLFFGHPEPRKFGERAERLVLAITAQAAVAFDNARPHQNAQREVEQRKQAQEALDEASTATR